MWKNRLHDFLWSNLYSSKDVVMKDCLSLKLFKHFFFYNGDFFVSLTQKSE